jgi:Tfp pilus assembly protein PilV
MERRTRNIDCRPVRQSIPGRFHSGFTLAESLIASVVLAAAVIGISGALTTSYQQSRFLDQTATALSLARELMEEIAAKPFSDPDGIAEASYPTRATRDNVADYHNYTDQSTTLATISGTVRNLTGSDVYTRAVTVTAGPKPSQLAASASIDNFKTVTVLVTTPSGQKVTISQLMTNAKIER